MPAEPGTENHHVSGRPAGRPYQIPNHGAFDYEKTAIYLRRGQAPVPALSPLIHKRSPDQDTRGDACVAPTFQEG